MDALLRFFSRPGIFPLFIVLFLLLTGIVFRVAGERVKRFCSILCLCVWGFGLLYVTWLSRTPVMETRIHLVPFQRSDPASVFDIITNILMFVPFPVLVYGLLQRKVSLWVLAAAGAGLSALIELLQLITHRGICDIDDLMLNSAGAVIGALLTVIWMKTEKR